MSRDGRSGARIPDAGAVPSPCINVCRMNPRTGWCDGCLRRIDEITDWALLSDEARRTIWQALAQRRAQHTGPAAPPPPATPDLP